jgi:hypothetical protein
VNLDSLPDNRLTAALELLRKLKADRRRYAACGSVLLLPDTPWGQAAVDLEQCGHVINGDLEWHGDGLYFVATLRGGQA